MQLTTEQQGGKGSMGASIFSGHEQPNFKEVLHANDNLLIEPYNYWTDMTAATDVTDPWFWACLWDSWVYRSSLCCTLFGYAALTVEPLNPPELPPYHHTWESETHIFTLIITAKE